MSIGPLRTGALLVSILIGVGAGVAAADLRDQPDDPRQPDQRAEPAADPEHLGIDMVNLDCTGQAVLVVGRGSAHGALAAAVAQNQDARYLRTADSCPTLWAPSERPVPEYAVYLGPMGAREACEHRMTPAHRGHFVTALNKGNEIFVKCGCELPVADRPTLRPGTQPDDLAMMWTGQLQSMLYDVGELTEEQVTGEYDPATVAVVKSIQAARLRPQTGTVDPDTWLLVQARACKTYDY